ncbi:TrbM/KikA/MpfK family conjugal transfer protein [Kistimonas asteriae]|uniref:TrbM/KikA/MpfK family conjugal transfer protein n=1 Tax=Kistimonas asteriae TaxID=517724 RepID=UPI001BA640F7
MKISYGAFALLLVTAGANADNSANLLQGDQRLACEAILCLSTGQPPSECKPALERYFGIRHKKPWKQARARQDFLNMCPTVSSSANYSSEANRQ